MWLAWTRCSVSWPAWTTHVCSTAEEKMRSSRQRKVRLRWRVPAVVELRSAARNYFVSTAGFWSWEPPREAAEIFWRQPCFSMPSSGDKTKCKQTEADRRIYMESSTGPVLHEIRRGCPHSDQRRRGNTR